MAHTHMRWGTIWGELHCGQVELCIGHNARGAGLGHLQKASGLMCIPVMHVRTASYAQGGCLEACGLALELPQPGAIPAMLGQQEALGAAQGYRCKSVVTEWLCN